MAFVQLLLSLRTLVSGLKDQLNVRVWLDTAELEGEAVNDEAPFLSGVDGCIFRLKSPEVAEMVRFIGMGGGNPISFSVVAVGQSGRADSLENIDAG